MMKVYLADLVYDTLKTNFVAPYNVALVAANLDRHFGKDLDIKIFKYPRALEEAVREAPPDLLGLSNYSWNTRLNSVFVDMAKRLNPAAVTIMGGPNIRTDRAGIRDFLDQRPNLDSYVMFEGEAPTANFVEALLGGDSQPRVPGCATLADGEFFYQPPDQSTRSKEIDLPSPYLTGWLDPFLKDPDVVPIFETNRGCPYGCVFCAWGAPALSKVRFWPTEQIMAEIDYIIENSVGQVQWTVCDANFGILPRDLDIARKMRSVMDANGFPVNVMTWSSKNAPPRNVEISQLLEDSFSNLVAIQSADPEVLEKSGRKNIKLEQLTEQVRLYHEKGLTVRTDLLLGLPGESAESHMNTLRTSFDMGFDTLNLNNIRALPGSELESDAYREKYEIVCKFRPLFGAYGVYDGRLIVEFDESIRATVDMTENELEGFKVHHWLIYFAWNFDMFKPLLKYGLQKGINPADVIDRVAGTEDPLLRSFFDEMRTRSTGEWFDTAEEMIEYYEVPENFDDLAGNFRKLNFEFHARAYFDPEIIARLKTVIIEELRATLSTEDQKGLDALAEVSDLYVCKNPLAQPFKITRELRGDAASALVANADFGSDDIVTVEISRPQRHYEFCSYYLSREDGKEISLNEYVVFFEIGGCKDRLRNHVEIIGINADAQSTAKYAVNAR